MVAAYLHMAQTSPNVYFFSTIPADAEGRPSGELSGFFDSVTAMITGPLRHLLGDPESTLRGVLAHGRDRPGPHHRRAVAAGSG